MKKLLQIASMELFIEALNITTQLQVENRADVFFDYSGHINSIAIRLSIGGWTRTSPCFDETVEIPCDTKTGMNDGIKRLTEIAASIPTAEEVQAKKLAEQEAKELAQYKALQLKFAKKGNSEVDYALELSRKEVA